VKHFALIVLGLALLALALLATGGCARGEQAPAPAAPQRVRTVIAAEQMTAQELASYGSISFQKKVDVTARVDGTVTEITAVEGASVEKGELLARLTNIQLELRKRQAESAASSARSELALAQARLWEGQLQVEARIAGIERGELELASKRRELDELAKTLKNKEQLLSVGGTTEEAMSSLRLSYAATETGVRLLEKDLEIRRIGLRDADIVSRGLTVPRDEVARRRMLVQIGTQTLAAETEVARARADSAAVELGAAEQLLAEQDIRAPLSGIVGARYVEAGEHAAADAKLFTLISTGEVYAVFPVPEAEAQHVEPGAAVDVSLDALGGAPFRAHVALDRSAGGHRDGESHPRQPEHEDETWDVRPGEACVRQPAQGGRDPGERDRAEEGKHGAGVHGREPPGVREGGDAGPGDGRKLDRGGRAARGGEARGFPVAPAEGGRKG
jgi:multidrug resistance efflux pump